MAEAVDPEFHNRAFWDGDADGYQAAHGHALAAAPVAWGVWRVPEATLGVLGDVADRDVLEYGCGAAQFGVALTGLGARVVGLDLSEGQLGHARTRVEAAATRLPLVCASATATPFADASFDVVFCDHGAMSFCDPARTVPECARLLRDGGRLVFLVGTQLLYLTWDDQGFRQTRRLHAPWQARRVAGSDLGTVDVIWSHGEWIRVLRAHDFVVDDLIEVLAPDGATTTHDFAPYRWARRWPAEEIWCATRRPRATR
ncbi:MAG: class I SAM-dependent methyltransferase [Actinobacteria bacterium]|nr:class I SAM-dependent methyltransferase [Actinomycetota bacterium]